MKYGFILALVVVMLLGLSENAVIGVVFKGEAGGIARFILAILCLIAFAVTWFVSTVLFIGIAQKQTFLIVLGVMGTVPVLATAGINIYRSLATYRAFTDADNPQTSPERLSELVAFQLGARSRQLENRIASHAKTPASALRELFQRGHTGTLVSLARNPNTPPDILMKLSRSAERPVVEALKANPNWKTQ